MDDRTRCARCESPIVDPTTEMIHGSLTYCCANCTEAIEQSGSGSAPRAGRYENALRCAHCDTPILEESTMVSCGDAAFCCANGAKAMALSGRLVRRLRVA